MQELEKRQPARKPLDRILVEGAFIKQQDINIAMDAARRTDRKLGEVLVESKLITPDTLATVLSSSYNLSLVGSMSLQVQPAALELIPKDLAKQHLLLPLSVDGDTLTVAIDDPDNLTLLDKLSDVIHKRIRPVTLSHGGLREAVGSYYKAS